MTPVEKALIATFLLLSVGLAFAPLGNIYWSIFVGVIIGTGLLYVWSALIL